MDEDEQHAKLSAEYPFWSSECSRLVLKLFHADGTLGSQAA
jgi:hypothetical protein